MHSNHTREMFKKGRGKITIGRILLWCQNIYMTQVMGNLMGSGLCEMGQFKTRRLLQRQGLIVVLRSPSVHVKNRRNI